MCGSHRCFQMLTILTLTLPAVALSSFIVGAEQRYRGTESRSTLDNLWACKDIYFSEGRGLWEYCMMK